MTTDNAAGRPWTGRNILNLFSDSLIYWNEARAFVYAAALAFYTIFSIVPLVVFIAGMIGQVSGAAEFEHRVVQYIAEQAGAVPGDFVDTIVTTGNAQYQSALATGIGLLFVLWGASSVFHSLQTSINAMYGMPEQSRSFRHGILAYLMSRLLSAFVVILIGLFFLLLLAANIFFTALPETRIEDFFQGWPWTQVILRRLVLPVIGTLALAVVYKALPGGQLRWRDVLPGAFLTMLLIAVGNRIVGYYLERIFSSSLYGASGSVILFLLWIYYLNLILLYGAKFIALYAERYGVAATPKSRLFVAPQET